MTGDEKTQFCRFHRGENAVLRFYRDEKIQFCRFYEEFVVVVVVMVVVVLVVALALVLVLLLVLGLLLVESGYSLKK